AACGWSSRDGWTTCRRAARTCGTCTTVPSTRSSRSPRASARRSSAWASVPSASTSSRAASTRRASWRPPAPRGRRVPRGAAGREDALVVARGALERRRGHAVLLAAASYLAGEGLRLRYVFCGDGREATALRGAAEPLGPAVRFAGFREDVPACLAAADV